VRGSLLSSLVEDHGPSEYLAECFWTGVKQSDLGGLDQRAEDAAVALSERGENVRYLGSLLMLDDEVVLCRFEGSEESVRLAARTAGVPYERIVKVTRSGWRTGPPE
jgi:hypothetical protein